MNLLEHYIKEVHGTKEIDGYPDMIEVDVTADCWGSVQRTKITRSKTGWEYDLEKGYFLA